MMLTITATPGVIHDPDIGDVLCCTVVDRPVGLDVCSVEAERVLLPIVGPTTLLLVRQLIRRTDETGAEFQQWTVTEMAAWLGVKASVALSSLRRARRFGLIDVNQATVVVTRRWGR